MKNYRRRSRWFELLTLSTCLAVAVPAYGAGKVLVVHSYHRGFDWVDAINIGLSKALQGTNAQMTYVYMDAKRNPQTDAKLKAAALAKEKVESLQPDVVMTSDDVAQQFFAKDYLNKPGPQFVFCGVNAELATYNYPGTNMSGVLERPHFVQTMQLLKQITPAAKTVGILSDDCETSKFMINQMLAAEGCPLKIISVEQPSTFADWQQAVLRLQATADTVAIVLYQSVKKEAGGKSMDPKEVIAWTLANLKKPTAGFFDWSMKDGVTCGIAESGEEHGYEAGLLIKALLAGQKLGDSRIKLAKKGTVILNLVAAQKIGVEVPFELIQSADLVIEK